MSPFPYSVLGGNALTDKDYSDIRKLGLTYKKLENGDLYYGQTEN
jgi:hypothetical protein